MVFGVTPVRLMGSTMLHIFKRPYRAIECIGTGVHIGSGMSEFTQDFPYVLSRDTGGKPVLPDVGKSIHTNLTRPARRGIWHCSALARPSPTAPLSPP